MAQKHGKGVAPEHWPRHCAQHCICRRHMLLRSHAVLAWKSLPRCTLTSLDLTGKLGPRLLKSRLCASIPYTQHPKFPSALISSRLAASFP
eukprot:4507518-Amphidinium_carterae.1